MAGHTNRIVNHRQLQMCFHSKNYSDLMKWQTYVSIKEAKKDINKVFLILKKLTSPENTPERFLPRAAHQSFFAVKFLACSRCSESHSCRLTCHQTLTENPEAKKQQQQKYSVPTSPQSFSARKQNRWHTVPWRHGDNQENKCWADLSGRVWLANKYAWA